MQNNIRTCISSKQAVRLVSSALRPRVLSGIQPTGTLHIGNYAGIIQKHYTFI